MIHLRSYSAKSRQSGARRPHSLGGDAHSLRPRHYAGRCRFNVINGAPLREGGLSTKRAKLQL